MITTITMIRRRRKGRKNLLEVMGMLMAQVVVVFHGCILISKVIKLYTLNMYTYFV